MVVVQGEASQSDEAAGEVHIRNLLLGFRALTCLLCCGNVVRVC